MTEHSAARKRTQALHDRAIRFSTSVNQSNKMRLALREAKESKTCLTKVRLAPPANATRVSELGLEAEADELCAIFATIIKKMEIRLGEQRYTQNKRRS